MLHPKSQWSCASSLPICRRWISLRQLPPRRIPGRSLWFQGAGKTQAALDLFWWCEAWNTAKSEDSEDAARWRSLGGETLDKGILRGTFTTTGAGMVMHLRQLRPRLAISVACWAREKISSHMSSAIDQNRLKLSGDVWFIDWCHFQTDSHSNGIFAGWWFGTWILFFHGE